MKRRFQYVIIGSKISWCNSESSMQSFEHDLASYYPVNDGPDQLVYGDF